MIGLDVIGLDVIGLDVIGLDVIGLDVIAVQPFIFESYLTGNSEQISVLAVRQHLETILALRVLPAADEQCLVSAVLLLIEMSMFPVYGDHDSSSCGDTGTGVAGMSCETSIYSQAQASIALKSLLSGSQPHFQTGYIGRYLHLYETAEECQGFKRRRGLADLIKLEVEKISHTAI